MKFRHETLVEEVPSRTVIDFKKGTGPRAARNKAAIFDRFPHISGCLRFAWQLWQGWQRRREFSKEKARLTMWEPDSVFNDLGISRDDLRRCTYEKFLLSQQKEAEVIPFPNQSAKEADVDPADTCGGERRTFL